MVYQFSRSYRDCAFSTGKAGFTNSNESRQDTKRVRLSPAYMAATYLRMDSVPTDFVSDTAALLSALSAEDGLDVIKWPRDYLIAINGGRKMLQQLELEIFYLDKHITVSFITEDSDPYTTEYHMITNVVGEGFVHQCRCVNVWARWFNDQFNYTMVTPLISKQ